MTASVGGERVGGGASAATAAAEPDPNVLLASQAAAGIVRVPDTTETRMAARSLTPNRRLDNPTRIGKPGGA